MALGVFLVSPATPAAAHNSFTGSVPANGARAATAPARIELRFLSKVDPGNTEITVTGPDNVPAAGGPPTFSGSRVAVPFKAGAAGLYIVGYRVGSADGHPVSGEIRFTLTTGTPAQPPSSSATAAASPSAAPSAPSSDAVPSSPSAAGPSSVAGAPPSAGTRSPAAGTSSDDGAAWPWLLAPVVLLVVLAAVFLALRRRR
ncbi:copper resistance CopC family protein [Micromonospora mirobrigensis]|uniref:copper resistance CopC family protein n=1 Tax=Micromonospora mirobrigensis TaxID=262898 RepID=UPI001FE1B493|nr:copper resistance CopC family protein [Micromonospora mirobrigensis]